MQQLPLFVFGTLRRGQCNHHLLCGKYDRSFAARLPGFGHIHPLMITCRPESCVEGELYFIRPECYLSTLAACDELEGLPPGKTAGALYRRIAVTVETDHAQHKAWAYVYPLSGQ